MIYLLILLGVVPSIYIFRYKLLLLSLQLFFKIYKYAFNFYEVVSKKIDNVNLKNVINLSGTDNKRIHEYELLLDNKKHSCCLIEKEDSDINLRDIYEEYKEKHINKTLFLHCNLSYNEDILIDLTTFLRKFVLHYHNEGNDGKMKYFFEYLHHIKEINDFIKKNYEKFDNSTFVIYLNDDVFTEKVYQTSEIQDMTFNEIIFNKI